MDLRIPSIEVPGSAQNSLAGTYLRGFMSRKPAYLEPGSAGVELHTRRDGFVMPGGEKLARYAHVCDFAPARGVPPTWPHILATPLQLSLVTAPDFPVRFAGLIHLQHRIWQRRPLVAGETMNIEARIMPHVDTTRGNEFDLETRIEARDGLAWTETLTFLARGPRSRPPRRRNRDEDTAPRWTDAYRFPAPANIGRRYARVSGDFNPIHLSTVTARWFGFSQPIAHGMWTLARSLAALVGNREAIEVQAEFRSPVSLPAELELLSREEGDSMEFELHTVGGNRPTLIGSLRTPEDV